MPGLKYFYAKPKKPAGESENVTTLHTKYVKRDKDGNKEEEKDCKLAVDIRIVTLENATSNPVGSA